jgi:hypothetical protein
MKRNHISMSGALLLLLAVSCFAQTTPTSYPAPSAPPAGNTPAETATPIDAGAMIKKEMRDGLNRRQEMADKWSTQAKHQIFLSVAVGFLGLVIGLLQSTEQRWKKGLTIALGFTVSALTLYTNNVYIADYRTLRRAAEQARPIMEELQQAVDGFDAQQNPQNLKAMEDDFYAKCGRFDKISLALFGGPAPAQVSTASNSSYFGFPVVHAQSQAQAPAWVATGLAADSSFTYFEATNNNKSLQEAKNSSRELALEKAAHWLRRDQSGQNQSELTQQLVALIGHLAEVQDSWYSYDRTSKVYRYSILLRLANGLQTLDVRVFDPENEFGSGIGPFHFGMTPEQVNALLPHPFANLASMPVPGEYKTKEVRYFWIYTAQFPPSPDSPASAFVALRPFQSCWGGQNSYFTFLFSQGKLMRISARFYWDCASRIQDASEFAKSYSIPATANGGSGRFLKVLTQTTVDVQLGQDTTSIDIFANGSPQPGG